jgi:hypothetical protein
MRGGEHNASVLRKMMEPIVQHMTPLAEAFEVDQPIAAAVRRFQQNWPTRGMAALVSPSSCFIIKPAASGRQWTCAICGR